MCKRIIFFALSVFSMNSLVLADEYSGAYLGFQMGNADLHYDSNAGASYMLPTNSVDSTKWTGRVYGGYAFSEFFATELGYNRYGKPGLTDLYSRSTQDFSQQGIDLSAKAILPLDYGFGMHLKVGGAWIHRSAVNSYNGAFVAKEQSNKCTLLGGLGVSYMISSNWSTDLSWTQSMSNGNLPKMDIYTLGFAYKF